MSSIKYCKNKQGNNQEKKLILNFNVKRIIESSGIFSASTEINQIFSALFCCYSTSKTRNSTKDFFCLPEINFVLNVLLL